MKRLIRYCESHNAHYDGIQPGPDDRWAHCVTDLVTGTTLCVMSMHDLEARLAEKRELFKTKLAV